MIIDSLTNALFSKNDDVCNAAVEALGAFTNAQAIAAIILSMTETNIHTSQAASANALERVGRPCVPQLLDALNKCATTNDADFTRWSAAVLADIGAIESIPTLQNIASSAWSLPDDQKTKRPPDPLARIDGRKDQLGDWPWAHNTSIGVLEWDLKGDAGRYDLSLTVDACAQATYALARIGKPALSNLVALTTGPTAWGRCRAIEGLSLLNINHQINEPEAIVALLVRLHDEDDDVRITARRALKSITGATTMNELFYNSINSDLKQQQSVDVSPLAVAYEKFVEENIVQVFSFGSESQRLTYMDKCSV
jgi:HEAT repeat protein